MALEPEDKKDLKRARVVLSKGYEVVGPSYSRVAGVAAKVTYWSENLGNNDRVSKTEQHYPSRVSQNSNTDRQADWVGQATQVRPSSNTDQRTYQVSRVSRVGNTKHKKEVPVVLLTQKSGLRRIRPTRKAGLQKIWLTQKAGLQKIWLTRKIGLWKIRLTQKIGLYRIWGARNRKKENVLLQAKGQLHGFAKVFG
jgi:hypothetical protein